MSGGWLERERGWLRDGAGGQEDEGAAELPPEAAATPPAPPASPPLAVEWVPVKCPACRSKNCPVTSKREAFRWHKCIDCGARFRSVEKR